MPVFDEKRKLPLLNNVLDNLDCRVINAFPMRLEGGHEAAFELLVKPEHRALLKDATEVAPYKASTYSVITRHGDYTVLLRFDNAYCMPIPRYAGQGLNFDKHEDIPPRLSQWIDIQFKLRGALACAKHFLDWANIYMEEADLRLYFPGVLALMIDPQFAIQKARMTKPKVTGYRPPEWAIEAGQAATRTISKAMLLQTAEGSSEVWFTLAKDGDNNRVVTPTGKSITLLH